MHVTKWRGHILSLHTLFFGLDGDRLLHFALQGTSYGLMILTPLLNPFFLTINLKASGPFSEFKLISKVRESMHLCIIGRLCNQLSTLNTGL